MVDSLVEAKSALVKAKDNMARYYNQRHTPAPTFSPGDHVFLDASDIAITCPSRKLYHHNLGPFTVVRCVGSNAYRLNLPHSMSRLHPVFNVVKLTSASPDSIPGCKSQPPPPPVILDNGEEYVVEKVLDSCMWQGKLQYKIWWKGYGIKEDSWKSAESVHADSLVHNFYCSHPSAPWFIASTSFANLSSNWRARDVAP